MNYRKDDLITLTIEDMGINGDGIGKIDGFAFFVKDAVVGDEVDAKIMKVKKGYAYAKLISIRIPSPKRTQPKCKFHKQCGGCQIQALDYKSQLAFKTEKVKNNLIRIGGLEPERIARVMEPIIGMDYPYHYRNKAQFPVGIDRENRIIAGFYAGRTHDIISNTNCILGTEENHAILDAILSFMQESHIKPYTEADGQGLVRHIIIRKGFATEEIMVCIVINGEHLPYADKLIEILRKIKGICSISLNINRERTNVIMGEKCLTLWGKDSITDILHTSSGDISFAISPHSFFQVNPVQTEKLYSLALEYANLNGTETVWDLYCGIGTISLFMAKRAKRVYGVEIVEQAVLDARQNAQRNQVKNVEFYVGKAEEVLPALFMQKGIHADVICVDPPRKGCDEACLMTMVKMAPVRIVYISCDSATLARDLKYLCAHGYQIERVCPVDLFPHTVHVETVCLLSRKPQ